METVMKIGRGRRASYKDRVGQFFWDAEERMLIEEYFETTEFLNDDAITHYHQKKVDTMLEHNAKSLIGDMRNMKAVVTMERMAWLNGKLDELAKQSDLRKLAFVQSAEKMIQLSVQTIFIDNDRTFDVKHFGSEEEALAWLRE